MKIALALKFSRQRNVSHSLRCIPSIQRLVCTTLEPPNSMKGCRSRHCGHGIQTCSSAPQQSSPDRQVRGIFLFSAWYLFKILQYFQIMHLLTYSMYGVISHWRRHFDSRSGCRISIVPMAYSKFMLEVRFQPKVRMMQHRCLYQYRNRL